jgi:hypothetical protein
MERVYNRKIINISDLKDRIREVIFPIPREMCVRAVRASVHRWFLCTKHNGEQVETKM